MHSERVPWPKIVPVTKMVRIPVERSSIFVRKPGSDSTGPFLQLIASSSFPQIFASSSFPGSNKDWHRPCVPGYIVITSWCAWIMVVPLAVTRQRYSAANLPVPDE
jgi:hypothetical protein